jgi:hypothetical protein
VIAQIVTGLRDAPDQRGRASRALADQEEGRLRAVGGQDVEDARRLLGIGAVVEGEGDLALRSRSAPKGVGDIKPVERNRFAVEGVESDRLGLRVPGTRASS